MPKPCLNRTPLSRVYCSISGIGNGAPPLVQNRSELKSACAQAGVWVSIWYIAGTAAKIVARSRWSRCSTRSGSNRFISTVVPPMMICGKV